MRIRFRPRIGPFVIDARPAPPRTTPVSRGEDLASALLVLVPFGIIAALLLAWIWTS